MPELAVRSAKGEAGSSITLNDSVFGGEPNGALLHQAVLRQLADRRQGTHDSQTRGEVSRTTKKVWRQKGTGRARQGSRKGPHWTGGGVVFGPHPRSHRQDLPKKMRAAAIRSALAAKTAAGELVLIDELRMARPSTKELAQLLGSLGDGGTGSTLLMTDGPQLGVQLSARNLPYVTVATTGNVSAYELMRHRRIVMTVAAARRLEARYGGGDESGLPEAETQTEIEVRAARPAVKVARPAAKAAGKTAAKAYKRAAPEGAPLTDAPIEAMPAGVPAEEAARPRRATKTAAKAAAKSDDAGDAADDASEATESSDAPATKTARKRASKSAAKSEE